MALKVAVSLPFNVFVTESITPQRPKSPELRFMPSMRSLLSAATTLKPQDSPSPGEPTPPPRRQRRLGSLVLSGLLVCAAVVGAALLRQQHHVSADVRSGSPGYKQSPKGKDLHWEKSAVTVYLDASLARLGPGANEAVMQAFGQWLGSERGLPALSFDTGQTSALPAHDGKSTVSFARITTPGHEHDVALTTTYSIDQTGEIIEADVVLNALYPLGVLTASGKAGAKSGSGSDGPRSANDDRAEAGRTSGPSADDEAVDCKSRYDVQNAATHEAGHFFGLGEDMTERGATMFYAIAKCETHKRVLAATDVGALIPLYPTAEAQPAAPTAASACGFGKAPRDSGVWAFGGCLLGLAALRRRRR